MQTLWIFTAVALVVATATMTWLTVMLNRSIDRLRVGVHSYVRSCRDATRRSEIHEGTRHLRHFTGR